MNRLWFSILLSAMESKLREVCDELVGPQSRNKSAMSKWESTILVTGESHLKSFATDFQCCIAPSVYFVLADFKPL